MIYLTEESVRTHTPWEPLVRAIQAVLKENDLLTPPRLSFALAGDSWEAGGRLLFMPSWQAETDIGIKTVTYRPDNGRFGLPSHGANYMLMDARSGRVKAVLEAHELTARRTAAVSVLAARYLARSDAKRLLIIGSGPVAGALASAHAASRHLERIEIFGRNSDKVDALIQDLNNQGIVACRSIDLATSVTTADIVCSATSARSPVLKGEWLQSGTHVDLIGSFTPEMREADDAVIAHADAIWVDTMVATVETGDLIAPLGAGIIATADIVGDLRDLIAAGKSRRDSEAQITVFKAVGFAPCDLAAARLALAGAKPQADATKLHATH